MDELTRLLLDARDGDRLALSTFIRCTQTDVWRFCAHLVDSQSADDLTQDVYLRVMRGAERFRGDASARTWLLSIARRACADAIRRRRRRRSGQRPHTAANESSPAGTVDLTLLLDELDTDRRQAFVLTQLIGMSYAEAAETCGVAVGTIRSRVARARQQLSDTLQRAERAET